MKESSFWSTSRVSHVNMGLIVRIGLALFTTIGSIVLALSLLSPNQSIYASGPIKNHGSGSIKPHAIVSATTTTNPWAEVLDGTGHIYVAEPGCALFPKCASTFTGVIGRYNTTNPTSGAVDYTEPSSGVSPALSSPGYLAIDTSGNIWFTEPTTGDIGELTPGATPVWQNWSTGSSSIPRDLTFDNFGNIWFTDPGNNKVSHFNTTTHAVDFSEPLSSNSDPWGILTDSAGNVWFGENGQANLGEIVPAASVSASSFHEYPITPNTSSHMLTLDSAGNIWYSEGSALALGKFDPTTHGVTNYSVNTAACAPNPPPCSSTVAGIGIDSTGKVWWDDQQNQHVGWLDPTTRTSVHCEMAQAP